MDSLDDERRIDRMRERARKLLDARLLREAKAAKVAEDARKKAGK